LNDSAQTRTDISFNVLGSVVSEMSENMISENSTDAIVKADAMSKVGNLKESYLNEIDDKNKEIDLSIDNIKKRIENYCISTLTCKEFRIELTMTLYDDHANGKLEFNIPSELRVPIFYLFNDTPPSLNLEDLKIYPSLYEFAPKEIKDAFKKIKPKYQSEKEKDYEPKREWRYYSSGYNKNKKGSSNSTGGYWRTTSIASQIELAKQANEKLREGYANIMKRYLSKIIQISLPDSEKTFTNDNDYPDKFSIPIGIMHLPEFHRIAYPEIFLYEKDKGILLAETYREQETANLESKFDKPEIRTLSFIDMKFEVENTVSEILVNAAGKVIAAFAKYNISNKLKYTEVILPIKNPNRRD